MPMAPEEQAAFDAAKAETASIKAELEALKKGPPVPPKKDDDPSVLEAARKKEQEDAARKATEKSVIEATKFSVSIKNMVGFIR